MGDGKFRPGQSGNPAGRRPGTKNRKTIFREELNRDGSELARVIKEKALTEGDMQAASMWLARIDPPLRPAAQCVHFDLNPDAPVADQAKQILLAVSKGNIDPDTGKQLLDMLSAFVGLKDVETFIAELKRLREAKQTHVPGGVIQS